MSERQERWYDKDIIEVQVKVPVCLTLRLEREHAESMLKDELCDVVDCVLQDVKDTLAEIETDHGVNGAFRLQACTEALRDIPVEWEIAPHWDSLPDDECEITVTEDGLFPERSDD